MTAVLHEFEAPIHFARVDAANKTIFGASLISVGEAKGHGVYIDKTTLKQVFDEAQEMGTVKVKVDHGSGVLSTIGYLDNFALSASQVTGDLHLYDTTDEKEQKLIFEIAEKNPAHLGLSIEFSGDDEAIGDKTFARCSELYTAALVSDPAANKSLFEKKKLAPAKEYCTPQPTEKTSMADKTTAPADKPADEQMPEWAAKLSKRFDDIEMRMSKYDETPETPDPEKKDQPADQNPPADDKEKLEKAAELGAKAAIKEMSARLGLRELPAGTPKQESDADPKEKTFAQLVEEKTAELGDKNKATLFCIKNHKKEYAAQRLVKI